MDMESTYKLIALFLIVVAVVFWIAGNNTMAFVSFVMGFVASNYALREQKNRRK